MRHLHMLSTRDSHQMKRHRLEVKGWKKILYENGNKQTKAGVAIRTLDKTDFKTEAL